MRGHLFAHFEDVHLQRAYSVLILIEGISIPLVARHIATGSYRREKKAVELGKAIGVEEESVLLPSDGNTLEEAYYSIGRVGHILSEYFFPFLRSFI